MFNGGGNFIIRDLDDIRVVRMGIAGQVLHAVVPRVAQIIMNTAFRMFPDSDAAKKDPAALPSAPTADQVAFQQFMRGIHF